MNLRAGTQKRSAFRKRLDGLAIEICDALATRFGPCNRNLDVDKDGATIELLSECHGDRWLHLGYFTEDEGCSILSQLKALPRGRGERSSNPWPQR